MGGKQLTIPGSDLQFLFDDRNRQWTHEGRCDFCNHWRPLSTLPAKPLDTLHVCRPCRNAVTGKAKDMTATTGVDVLRTGIVISLGGVVRDESGQRNGDNLREIPHAPIRFEDFDAFVEAGFAENYEDADYGLRMALANFIDARANATGQYGTPRQSPAAEWMEDVLGYTRPHLASAPEVSPPISLPIKVETQQYGSFTHGTESPFPSPKYEKAPGLYADFEKRELWEYNEKLQQRVRELEAASLLAQHRFQQEQMRRKEAEEKTNEEGLARTESTPSTPIIDIEEQISFIRRVQQEGRRRHPKLAASLDQRTEEAVRQWERELSQLADKTGKEPYYLDEWRKQQEAGGA